MSRSMELNAEREADLATILTELQITEDQMCHLKPADTCEAAPKSISFNQ